MVFDETLWFLDEVLSFEKVFSVNDSVEVRGTFACSDLITHRVRQMRARGNNHEAAPFLWR